LGQGIHKGFGVRALLVYFAEIRGRKRRAEIADCFANIVVVMVETSHYYSCVQPLLLLLDYAAKQQARLSIIF
jgi:hypothetical protein